MDDSPWRSYVNGALEQERIRWRDHVLDRMRERGLCLADLVGLLRDGVVIEQDDARRPFPTAVLLARVGQRPMHVVVAWQHDLATLHVVTVYDPDLAHFESDLRRRRR